MTWGLLDVSPHRLLPGYFFLSYECKILASILHVFDHKLTRPIFILLHVCVLHCFHVLCVKCPNAGSCRQVWKKRHLTGLIAQKWTCIYIDFTRLVLYDHFIYKYLQLRLSPFWLILGFLMMNCVESLFHWSMHVNEELQINIQRECPIC